MERIFCADAHCDSVTAGAKGRPPQIDWATLPMYMDLQFFAIYLENESDPAAAATECAGYYQDYQQLLTRYDEQLAAVVSAGELEAVPPGKTAALLAMENCAPLLASADVAANYYTQGFRSFGLVWNHDNGIAGGALSDSGLTEAGRWLVRELAALPAIIDLAHCNRRSFYEALSAAARPVLVSHTCCDGRCRHPRNLSDEQLRELAQAGGMVGITFARSFLSADGEATMDTVVDHVAHAAYVIGTEAICFGSDFDGTDLPVDMGGQSDLVALRRKLRERGFSESEARAIGGGNLRRFTMEQLL